MKGKLGHKRIKTTLIYTHLLISDDEYVSAVAETVGEVRKLIEASFEYEIEMDKSRIFRRRK